MSDKTRSNLGSLTREQKIKAFEKASNEIEIENGKLVLIEGSLYDEVMVFLLENFVPYEPLAKAFGCLTCPDDWKRRWLEILKFNLSLGIIDRASGKLMAVGLMSICNATEKKTSEIYFDKNFKNMTDYKLYCDTSANFYTHFEAEEGFHINDGGAALGFRNNGIFTKLAEATSLFMKKFDIFPIHVKVKAASNIVKKITENLGFETLYENLFSDYRIDGKDIIKNTGEHKSMKVYGKRMDSIKCKL